MKYDSSPQLFVSCVFKPTVAACKKAARLLATLGGPLKVVALLPSLHANMHHRLFLFYLDPAASSPVLSWSHLGYKKKRDIYIRRIMCFEKPSDIRIWLVQSNLKATLGLCIEASAALPFPVGECSLRKKGLTNSQSERIHKSAQSRSRAVV